MISSLTKYKNSRGIVEHYEGFGLTIIESASCGTPVIVRKKSRIHSKIFKLASDRNYYLKERRKAIKQSKKIFSRKT